MLSWIKKTALYTGTQKRGFVSFENDLLNLTGEDKLIAEAIIAKDLAEFIWRPLINIDRPEIPTPQQQAYDCLADILLFGGAAGGSKTNLLIVVSNYISNVAYKYEFESVHDINRHLNQNYILTEFPRNFEIA